jgi:two-component system cell cycle response regulator
VIRTRNGAGSAVLKDASTKFKKSYDRLIKTAETCGVFTSHEAGRCTAVLEKSLSQKRASDIISSASSLADRISRAMGKSATHAGGTDRKELEVLFEISKVIQLTQDPEKTFRAVLEVIKQAIPYENATLFLMDKTDGELRSALTVGDEIDLISEVKFDHGMGFSGWVAKEKKPVLLKDLRADRKENLPEIASFLSIPLVVQTELIGVINLSHSKAGAFDEDDLRLLTLISGQAAAAIHKHLLYKEMEALAITDGLTSLYNRRHFEERLASETLRGRRYLQEFSIIVMDIDNFKRFNDSCGHTVGDAILKEFASLLTKCARGSDVVARYGGDEFIMLLPCTSRDSALAAAERIRAVIEKCTFPRRKKLTVSLGVASFPNDAEDGAETVSRADEALYVAKRLGRNRAVAFDPNSVN